MSLNGAGVYSLPAGNPVVTGTTISSTWANNTLTDIGTALSTAVYKDGQQTITANIPMSGFKFTGLAAGTAPGNSLRYEQVIGVYATPSEVVLQTLADAKGDMIAASAADTWAKLSVGANGTIAMARSAATLGLAYVAAFNKAIYGLTYDVGTDTTNDININTGGAMDATGAYWMTLATALGKQSDVAWAVGGTTGTPLGWLDTGAVGNSDYYIWLIARSDTGVVDSLCSLSSTAPTMPSNYDFKRLIGWFKRVGGTIVAFKTYETWGGGIEMTWDVPTLDINLANTLTTSRRTDAVKVPLNFSTIAHINVSIFDATTAAIVNICCPDQTDAAPSGSSAPLGNIVSQISLTSVSALKIRTSAAGLIAARSTLATVDLYAASTFGFEWARRN